MRNRSRSSAAAVAAGGFAGVIMRNPRETVALTMGGFAILWIVVNALWLQAGPHPHPIFAGRSLPFPQAASPDSHDAVPLPVANPVAARNDPIADLIAPSKQVVAVQRALSDFGYGQIRPNGIVGPDTKAAIERFERKNRMPVTGQISDKLLTALSTMTGQTIR